MLSNPQNLDIRDLCAEPQKSPFAQCLRVSKHMLVVPNQTCSVYSRIWCAYEAFLAVQLNKNITTAELPVPGLWRRMFEGVATFCLAFAVAIVMQAQGCAIAEYYEEVSSVWMLCILTVYILDGHVGSEKAVRYSLTLAFLASGYDFAIACADFDGFLSHVYKGFPNCRNMLWRCFITSQWFALLLFVPCCFLADSVWLKSRMEHAMQLSKGFTTVVDARASVQFDKHQILEEINRHGGPEVVDRAVRVLMRCGSSSPNLRRLADQEIDTMRAGVYSLGSVVWVSLIFAWNPLYWLYTSTKGLATIILAITESMTWIGCCFVMTGERRAFAACVADMFLLRTFMLAFPLEVVLDIIKSDVCAISIYFDLARFLMFPLVLALTFVGPVNALRIPGVGWHLTQLVVTGGTWW